MLYFKGVVLIFGNVCYNGSACLLLCLSALVLHCFIVYMFNWLHNYSPQPILIELGPFQIHWYGFLMVIGGLAGFYLILRLAKKYQLDKKLFEDLFFYWVIGALIGARIYYVLYAWEFYRDNWLDILKVWEGGLAIHGIMIGGFIATLIFCKVKKQNFWLFADIAVVGLSAAQVIGRVGNYFNQEIFGLPTKLPWGIPIELANRPAEFISSQYFHPTFLYESLGSLLIVTILLLATNYKSYKGYPPPPMLWRAGKLQINQSGLREGNIFFIYLILYSVLRFSLEFLRTDYSPLIVGIRWAQIFSVLIVLTSAGALIYRKFKKLE